MPGMTATVSVIVDRRDDVLRVPAAALRFRPEGFDPVAATRGAGSRPGSPAAGDAPGGQGAGGASGGGRRRRGGGGGDAPQTGGPAAGASPAATDMAARPAGRAGGGGRPTFVFVLGPEGEPEPARIRPGITDGQYVEVVDGLAEGQPVITAVTTEARGANPPAGASPAANPFAPGRPQRRSR